MHQIPAFTDSRNITVLCLKADPLSGTVKLQEEKFGFLKSTKNEAMKYFKEHTAVLQHYNQLECIVPSAFYGQKADLIENLAG